MTRLIVAIFSMALLISGCSHVMSESNLQQVDRSVRFEELSRAPENYVGRTVLLGGIIADIVNSGDLSMLEVVQLDLFRNEVPNEDSPTGGRFLVLSSQMIDPVIYQRGKLITVIGEVKGRQIQKKDGADVPYPLIAVREQRIFRSSEPSAGPENPYQNQFGDEKFQGRPPGFTYGEPRKFY